MGKVNPVEAAALRYVAMGWAVLPLCPNGKEPFTPLLPVDRFGKPSWKMLAFQPVTSLEVQQWFKREPRLNIGVITGEPSGGLVVVDVDRQPKTPIHLPPTIVACSGRPGGSHYYYTAKERTNGRRFPWGDLKAEGGYVVAPPSLHPSGTTYQWADFCGPDEIEVAELPADLLEQAEASREPRYKDSSVGQVSKRNISSCLPSPDAGEVVGSLHRWLCREDVAAAIMRLCGVPDVRLGKGFCCPLPGHHESKPSASLWRMPDETIGFRDWHQKSGPAWFSLPEVFAAVRSGRVEKLGGGEMAAWFLRALIEAGFLKAPTILAPKLPANVTPIVRDVFEGFKRLLMVRAIYDPNQQPGAPFSWRFAAAWCGRSQRHTGEAVQWLLREGFLRQVGEVPGKRKMALFGLGAPREDGGYL